MISTLAAGGAERVLTLLAGAFAEQGHQVTVITYAPAADDFYRLPARVRRLSIDTRVTQSRVGRAFANIRRVGALRRALSRLQPDAVIAFIDAVNIVTLLASYGREWPVIVSERTDPRRWPIGPFWGALRRLMYPRADALVAQTPSVAEWLVSVARSGRIQIIPNPVMPATVAGSTRGTMVLGVGRLRPEKGFDLLVTAFARVAQRHPRWQLRIVGDGPERRRLAALAAEAGLGDRVRFAGPVADPGRFYREASIFALPSRLEGFPNTLVEAMAHGLAVIAADCDSGPRDIVTNGVDGLLVPPEDVAALAAALDELITNEGLRRRLAAAATAVVDRYSLETVTARWLDLVEHVRLRAGEPRRGW